MSEPAATLRLDLHVHLHHDADPGVAAKLDLILAAIAGLQHQGETMSKELDDLTAQVAANTAVETSAVTLIQGLAAQIAAAQNDPAQIAALSASLKTSADALAAAITANTPAAPPAPPTT